MKKRLTNFACGLLLMLCIPGAALAQEGTLTGTVVDGETGAALPGANVVIDELQRGTAADGDGSFTLTDVPAGTYTLGVSFIGYQRYSNEVVIQAGETTTTEIEMEPDAFGLDEVVVTGVGRGTATKKLGFSVSKVDVETLEKVPATDPANALRGKVPGAMVVQGSGDPSADADIRLRGSTSISGDQSPLIIVDGVITSGSLRDINMEDVESIEVVKGAAAASLYGSLAGNGVIQVRTKRGDAQGGARITFRSEVGISTIAGDYPVATQHPWVLDTLEFRLPNGNTQTLIEPTEQQLANVSDGARLIRWDGRSNETIDDGFFDNPYPILRNNVDAVFTGQPFNTNYISIGNSSEDYNYFASFENMRQGGVLEPVEPYSRNTFRLNADYIPMDRLAVKFSGSYINVTSPRFEEQGQGDNFFYSILTADPFIDLTETTMQGGREVFSNRPTGYAIQGSNWQNPLYVAQQRERGLDRDRVIAGVAASYDLANWVSLNARQSLDRGFTEWKTFYPVGFTTPTPSPTVNDGYDFRRSIEQSTSITEAWTEFAGAVGEFNLSAVAKYLYENRDYEWFEAEGSRYSARGVRDIGSLDPETFGIDSYQTTERAENYFFDLSADYQEKIILGGLIRRDGSSSFGTDERWQTYYRGSLAYRLSEDFDIPNVNELKLRASYGTSGQRPPFEAQYETFSATSVGLEPNILGNEGLKPSTVKELETGINLAFLDRFTFEANYALTQVENDYLEVPLSALAGFQDQWQNVGEIESTALEFALGGRPLEVSNFSWDLNLTFSHITQEITDLGDVPAFTRTIAGTALNLFRVEEGVPYGAMYGNEIATSLDQLTVGEGGEVLNGGTDTNGDGRLTRDDYAINDQGYVVPAGTHGTAAEQVVYLVNENGERLVTQIGDTQPDFSMGFSSTLTYRGLALYALLDWVSGGDVYNYTKQLLYFNYRHEDQQELAAEGYHLQYTDASSAIYNGANASSYFVEDAGFVKLREVSLAYNFTRSQLGPLGQYINGLKLGVLGRNLLTFTDYTGWDPEVALRTNATNFRLDEYAYPNFRTFTGSVEIRF